MLPPVILETHLSLKFATGSQSREVNPVTSTGSASLTLAAPPAALLSFNGSSLLLTQTLPTLGRSLPRIVLRVDVGDLERPVPLTSTIAGAVVNTQWFMLAAMVT